MKNFGTASGRKFRLSICLKRFYSDERRRCYVSVYSGLRVRWLAARLRRLFSMTGHFCLLSDGHLLPPDESLDLLSPDDVVEAIPKYYSICEDESESEFEILFNTREQNDQSTRNKEQSNIDGVHNQGETIEQKLQIPPVLGQCNLPSSRQEVNEKEISRATSKSDKRGEDEVDTLGIPTEQNENGLFGKVENNLLNEVKMKALQLLDECSTAQKKKRIENVGNEIEEDTKTSASESVIQGDPPEKRKRKRVRRRRPRAADPSAPTDASVAEAAPGDHLDESLSSEMLILRNNADQNRTARLVYSLS